MSLDVRDLDKRHASDVFGSMRRWGTAWIQNNPLRKYEDTDISGLKIEFYDTQLNKSENIKLWRCMYYQTNHYPEPFCAHYEANHSVRSAEDSSNFSLR